MKPKLFSVIVALALAGYAHSVRAADPATWGTVRALTVALTISSTAPGTSAKDENGKIIKPADGGGPAYENSYSVATMNANGDVTKQVDTSEYVSKVVTSKFGNVEILKQLLVDGLLILNNGNTATSIAGWSIVMVGDMEGTTTSIYARHAASKSMVSLDDIVFGPDPELMSSATTENWKEVITTNTNPNTGDSTTSRVVTSSFTTKGQGLGTVSMLGQPVALTGLYTETGSKVVIKTETIDGEKIYTDVWVPGAAKLDKAIGSSPPPDEGNAGVIEGSLSAPAATVTDMNIYMPAI